MPHPSERHYTNVALALRNGDVVPFLGAGANLSGRSLDVPFRPKQDLPSGDDLARYLAEEYYAEEHAADLLRVAQFIATMSGYPRLYKTLHELFDADFSPTGVHVFLAGLPTLLSGAAYADRNPSFSCYQLIVTTNYDDTLERAFEAVGEAYDLVTYKAEGAQQGRFLHWQASEEPAVIVDPNAHRLPLDERTVILKIHGLVVRVADKSEWESFVITEDHYIDYLAHDLANLLPVQIVERLRNSNLLFLGYALRDWNLRVILQSIWKERDLEVPSWAVQIAPDDFDEIFWGKRDVTIFDESLDVYVQKLDVRLREMAPRSRV